MFGVKRVLFAAFLGGAGMYFADHYHVVNSVDGLVVIPRAQQVPLRTVYADVRGWDATKWAEYPELSESLLKDGRGGLLVEEAADGLLRKLGDQFGLTGGSSETSAATPASPERPSIVFQSPEPAVIPKPATTDNDDSLLSRLSRQLQETSTAPAPVETPVDRYRDLPSFEPTLGDPAPLPSSIPSGEERAGVIENFLPDDLLPSIHSAACRITTQLQQQAPQPTAPAPKSAPVPKTDWLPTFDQPEPVMRDVAKTLLDDTKLTESIANSISPGVPSSPYNAAGETVRPLDIDAQRLRQSLPDTVRQSLLRSLEDQSNATLESLDFKSF